MTYGHIFYSLYKEPTSKVKLLSLMKRFKSYKKLFHSSSPSFLPEYFHSLVKYQYRVINIYSLNGDPFPPLYYSFYNFKYSLILFLRGSSLNQIGDDGQWALSGTAQNKDLKYVRLFYTCNVDMTEDITPLDAALINKNTDEAKELIRMGADVSKVKTQSILAYAAGGN